MYDVSEIKSEVAIMSQQTATQTVGTDAQPELLRHLHLSSQELQPRIMQHIQQQTQTNNQVVNPLHKMERF